MFIRATRVPLQTFKRHDYASEMATLVVFHNDILSFCLSFFPAECRELAVKVAGVWKGSYIFGLRRYPSWTILARGACKHTSRDTFILNEIERRHFLLFYRR